MLIAIPNAILSETESVAIDHLGECKAILLAKRKGEKFLTVGSRQTALCIMRV